MTELPAAIQDQLGEGLDLATGTVTAYVASTQVTTVTARGGVVDTAGRNAAYTPAVGDTVALLRSGNGKWLILFKMAGPGA